jgi:hypothetical protein
MMNKTKGLLMQAFVVLDRQGRLVRHLPSRNFVQVGLGVTRPHLSENLFLFHVAREARLPFGLGLQNAGQVGFNPVGQASHSLRGFAPQFG